MKASSLSFDDIYATHRDTVLRVTLSTLSTWRRNDIVSDSEDAAQDAWLKIAKLLRTDRDVDCVEAMVVTIAARAAFDLAERDLAVRRRRSDVALDDAAAVASPDDDLAVQVERREMLSRRRAWLDSAMERLSPSRARVIRLRCIDGLSVAETAAAMGITDNAVKVLAHRAEADLRRMAAFAEDLK